MNTVDIEDLVGCVILNFLENTTELGCSKDEKVDVWFKNLNLEEIRSVAEKLLDIIEKNAKKFQKEDNEKCPQS